jgi:Domain of unknown function (DUF4149)
MRHLLRFMQIFALGVWIGSIFYFSAAVAPGAFRVLPNQDDAGRLIEFTLGRLHLVGVVAALLFLLASFLLSFPANLSAKRLLIPAIGVALMLGLTLISQDIVIRRMAKLRREMVSVIATPPASPLRQEFDRLHGVSVDLEGAVLLIGFACLFLTTRIERS